MNPRVDRTEDDAEVRRVSASRGEPIACPQLRLLREARVAGLGVCGRRMGTCLPRHLERWWAVIGWGRAAVIGWGRAAVVGSGWAAVIGSR
jgi:hypothetical protein